jgi:hypothetical protein
VVWWVHNASVGRNPLASETIARYAASRGDRVLWHQHDLWFDHRWERRREFQLNGLLTTEKAVMATLPAYPRQAQITLHEATTRRLHEAGWPAVKTLPNPPTPWASASTEAVAQARQWVESRLGSSTPYWLMPSRVMRRKNILEAVLLLQLLQPAHSLLVTAGPSSAAEHRYAQRIHDLTRRHRFPLLTALNAQPDTPSLPALLAASAGVFSTSLFEGHGLTLAEAAAAGKRVIARHANPSSPSAVVPLFLPEPTAPPVVQKNSLIWMYLEVMVPTEMLGDYLGPQRQLYELWCLRHLSGRQRRAAIPPPWWEEKIVPFSRLTLADQETVLSQLPARRDALLAVNPWLLQLSDWLNTPITTHRAPMTLDLSHWADRFAESVHLAANTVPRRHHTVDAWELATTHLKHGNHFPLLWDESLLRAW